MDVLSEYQNTRKWKTSPYHTTISGVGVGFRSNHFEYIEKNKPDIPWFEVLIDNYLMEDSSSLYYLSKTVDEYPITFHGVGMSLGSTGKLNFNYLKKLKKQIKQFNPVYVSDHLCWTSVNGYHSHDLLPMPYTEEAIEVLVNNIRQVQNFLERRILLENASSYLTFKDSIMDEWTFLKTIVEESDCDILLDINNIHVSAINHKMDATTYLQNVPIERVKEMHLAGYSDQGGYLLDTHGEAVHPPVWELYEQALSIFGNIPTLIEWDNGIPDFPILQAEAKKAASIMQKVNKNVA